MTDRPEEEELQERQNQTRRQGAVYQGAFEAVIALLVAVYAGYWLDGFFETEPVLLLVVVCRERPGFPLSIVHATIP